MRLGIVGARFGGPFALLIRRQTRLSRGVKGIFVTGITSACRNSSVGASQLATDVVTIEPRGLKHGLVTTEALTQREFHVAFEPRPGRGEMIFAGSLARSQHGLAGIVAQAPFEIGLSRAGDSSLLSKTTLPLAM